VVVSWTPVSATSVERAASQLVSSTRFPTATDISAVACVHGDVRGFLIPEVWTLEHPRLRVELSKVQGASERALIRSDANRRVGLRAACSPAVFVSFFPPLDFAGIGGQVGAGTTGEDWRSIRGSMCASPRRGGGIGGVRDRVRVSPAGMELDGSKGQV
jgi:hypothetical protein